MIEDDNNTSSKERLIDKFDLRSKLKFNQETGKIWLDENRLLLWHAKALREMRYQLFNVLDSESAKRILIRIGYIAGEQDADLAHKLAGDSNSYDAFQIGPELHAFEGHVKSTISNAEIDWETGSFNGEVIVENSWEAEAHLQSLGLSEEAACWTLIGYATGYTSRFFKRFIVFKETSCMCAGDHECHFVGKPADCWDDDNYVNLFRRAPLERNESLRAIEDELNRLRGNRPVAVESDGLVGVSTQFVNALKLVQRAANSPINVLLLGETGVGKEVFARWLHDHSNRKDKPFIAVNCGAIPHELIESELFGVRKGAFTGAQDSRPGRFERADGGTLFLDELGDLSLAAQVKLLRVLQTGEVERLGDDKLRKVDVRLVAATNVDLQKAIKKGEFRADLYYRIATYPVQIPPLRERPSDIMVLANAMLEKFAESYEKNLSGLSERAIQYLTAYRWPGNVRELENIIERGVLLASDGGQIEVEHLFVDVPEELKNVFIPTGGVDGDGNITNESANNPGSEMVKEANLYDHLLNSPGFSLLNHEDRLCEEAVNRANGNLTHAAKLLGITRRQLAYRIQQKVK